MDASERFDVVVIGSGPAGRAAALESARLGLRAALVERRTVVGGVCVNAGTVPSKLLRAAALNAAAERDSAALRSRPARIDLRALLRPVSRLVADERTLLQRELDDAGVVLITGAARLLDAHHVRVEADTLSARVVVLATGSEAAAPVGAEADGQHVLLADQVLGLAGVPLTLTVVGGGLVGVEYASIFATLGSHVVVLEEREQLLPFAGAEAVAELVEQLSARGVHVRTSTRAAHVERRADPVVRTHLADGSWIQSTALLWAAGRRGAVDGLGLDAAGIATDGQGRVMVDARFRTSNPDVLAVGDVVGWLPSLSSTSAAQGRYAVAQAFGESARLDPRSLPFGVHAIPELASVGATQEALVEEERPFVVGRARLEDLTRARLAGHAVRGLLHLHVDAGTGRVLGGQVVGGEATELVHLAALAIQQRLHVRDLAALVPVHPSLHEAYGVAAADALRQLSATGTVAAR
jgi:NAD(P) transhydrogenase